MLLLGYGLSAAALHVSSHSPPLTTRIAPLSRIRMLSSENDLAKLTVAELKEKLREAGLKVSGRKAELIERLREGASPGGATVPSAPAPSAHSPASANPFASMLFPEPQNPTFPPIAIEHCKS